jgi:hypothetical protein
MNYTKPFVMSLLASSLMLSAGTLARADSTEETTVKTTTVTTGTALPLTGETMVSLPANGSYLVVDPITGLVQGDYEPMARLVNGRNLKTGSVIVEANSGKLLATVDSAGNIVDVTTFPATQTLILSIDSRRKELDRQIAEALNQGQISAQQAARLRSELAQISTEELGNSNAPACLTFQKAMNLGYSLNTLSERLVPITSTMAIQPVIAPQFVTINGQLAMVDTVTSRRLLMATRIQDEYAAGRLSGDQVAQLNSELDRIASLETKYRRDGQLSEAKDRALSIKLDQVHSSLEHDVAIINQKRSGIGLRTD